MKVLVKEKIGESGVELLRSHGFTVDIGTDWSQDQLEERIGDYEGLLIRSATQVDADLLAKATRLRAVGRAGVGVDNVDVAAATKRGVVVANAPESNVVTAAEHTLALLLSLARNIPQAHASLVQGRWERSKYSGVELMDKTLGIIGFGRIGQLVAQRAQGFGMRVIAYDPFVGPERYRELGVEKGATPEDVYAVADFITIHLPKTPDTANWLNAEAFAKMRDGVRVLNVARGGLVDEAALKDALDSGKVAGAALDVFPAEPTTEHPLFGYPNVVVTPHLGASTAEATDRAGFQAAEQVAAALNGGTVTSAVNMPAIGAEDLEVLGPFVPLCTALGRFATAMAQGMSIERVEVELLGRIGDRDARPLTTAVLLGVLSGHTEEELNAVNVHSVAADRGIELVESRRASARDFSDLIRVTVSSARERQRVVGTTLGRRHRPHLLEAWGQRFNLQLEPYVTLLKYRDVPGMIGKLGTCFGHHGLNIELAAVGHRPDDDDEPIEPRPVEAVMAVTTDQPVPASVLDEIVSEDGFVAARFVSLAGTLG
jgi:D-3-phosphoglycerate dehydrogenase / 2-oxoglutarate reductase